MNLENMKKFIYSLILFLPVLSLLSGFSYISPVSLDLQNPDYKKGKSLKEYMIKTRKKIEEQWKPGSLANYKEKLLARNTIISFRILSTGALVENKIVNSAGIPEADSLAMNSILNARPFEVPPELKEKQLLITASFCNSELYRLYGETRKENSISVNPEAHQETSDANTFDYRSHNEMPPITERQVQKPYFPQPISSEPITQPITAIDPGFKIGDLSYKHIKLGIPIDQFRRISFTGLADEKYPQPTDLKFSTDAGLFDKPYSSYPGITVAKFYGKYGECYVGLATVQSKADFKFIRASDIERLAEIDFAFDSGNYLLVREALALKYGKPLEAIQNPVQNRMGAKFTDERLVWRIGNCEIRAFRFMPDLTKSYVEYVFLPLQNKMKEIKGLDKDPSKDL